MARWLEKDAKALEEMKKIIQSDLDAYPPYPEVVGDRRLLRFIGGFNGNVEKAADAYLKFLKWRKDSNVDEIRNNILYGGINHPKDFPQGELILKVIPQIVISPHAYDRYGQPLTLEIYSFDPTEVLNAITIDEYLIFLIYSLEFRTLILEQLADEREAKYVKEHAENLPDGYGNMHMLKLCCFRDLNGVGFKHLGSKTKSILKVALDIALPNYPEYLGKSHMVNVPWIFETLWVFVKGLLDEGILKKIALLGVNFMDELMKDIPFESIPQSLGGSLPNDHWGFDFDISPTGLFSPEKLIQANIKIPIGPSTGQKHPSDSDKQYISMQNGVPVNSYSDGKSSYNMITTDNGGEDEGVNNSSSPSMIHNKSRSRGSITNSLNKNNIGINNMNNDDSNMCSNNISPIHARRSQSFSAKDLMANNNNNNSNHGIAGNNTAHNGETASVDSKASSAFRTSSIPVLPSFLVNSVTSVNNNVNALFFHSNGGNNNNISSAHTSVKVLKSMKSPAKKHHQFSTLETPRSVSTADDAAVILDEYDKYSNVNEINRKTLRHTDKDHIHNHSGGGLLTLHAPKFGNVTNPFATMGNYALPSFSVPNAFSLNTSTSRSVAPGATSPVGVYASSSGSSSNLNDENNSNNNNANINNTKGSRLDMSSGSCSVASSAESFTNFSPGKPILSSSSSASSTTPQLPQSVAASSVKKSGKQLQQKQSFTSSSTSSSVNREYEETTKPSYTYGMNSRDASSSMNNSINKTDVVNSLTSISEVVIDAASSGKITDDMKRTVTTSISSSVFSSSGNKRDVAIQTMESSFSSAAIKRSQLDQNAFDNSTTTASSSSVSGVKRDTVASANVMTSNNSNSHHHKLAITLSPMAFVFLASVFISALYFTDYPQTALILAIPTAVYIVLFFFVK